MILSLITSGYRFDILIMHLLATMLSTLIAIVFHESAHAVMAHWCGDDTAKNAGRMTLNPIPHFDLIGAILILFVGFGWAKPVPVNPGNFKNGKIGIFLVSIAGIATNLLVSGICLLLLFILNSSIYALLASSNIALTLLAIFIYYLLAYSVIINIMLAFFNILPIAPLDGFNLLNVLLPRGNGYSAFMFKYGWYILLGILVISHILNYVGLEEYNVFYLVQKFARTLISLVTGG